MFDHLYILAKGKCLYQGSVKGMLSYLEQVNLRCPTYHNPADYGKYKVIKPYRVISNSRHSFGDVIGEGVRNELNLNIHYANVNSF